MPSKERLPQTAIQFCVEVDERQKRLDDYGVPLEESQRQELTTLVAAFAKNSLPAGELDRRARDFLLIFREAERQQGAAFLNGREQRQLRKILFEKRPKPAKQSRSSGSPVPGAKLLVASGVIVLAAIGGFVTYHIVESSKQGAPPPGIAQQHPPAQQVAPGNTDLQNLKQNYGPWEQLTPSDQRPQTGQPGLLLLEDGGYYLSKWTVSPTAAGWQQDLGGHVSNVATQGTHADITDADGSPYVVGVDQPFVVSSDPNTVVKIDPTGNVSIMTLAQATAVRQPLNPNTK